jgi:uncharacterized protein
MKILSIDGGGYLGLATASFIEETERHFCTKFHDEFDLFCGTSTGAIIALCLASGMTGEEIRRMYEDFGPKVFSNYCRLHRWLRKWPWGIFFSRYSNTPLRHALEEAFGEMTLGDILKRDKKVLVTAYSLTNGRPWFFKTNHSPTLTRDNGYKLVDIAMASSAAPTYLPEVELKDPSSDISNTYCDGGVVANHPALLGYAEAVYELKSLPASIKILSLSTPRVPLAISEVEKNYVQRISRKGIILWGSKLADIFIDSNSQMVDQLFRRIVKPPESDGPTYIRIMLERPACLELDTADAAATTTLKQIGMDKASSGVTRQELQKLFNHGGNN